jgi:hypothetical protein
MPLSTQPDQDKGEDKITYYYPDDFAYKVSSAPFMDAVSKLGQIHDNRLVKYNRCWDFYRGNQWPMEDPEGFDQITVNFAKKFVQKIRRFAFRNDWTATMPEDSQEEAEDWLKEVWHEQNDLHEITAKLTEYGGVFGDWYAYVQWSPEDPETGIGGKINITPIDPRFAYPEYNTLTGEIMFLILLVPFEEAKFLNDYIVREEYVHRDWKNTSRTRSQPSYSKQQLWYERY